MGARMAVCSLQGVAGWGAPRWGAAWWRNARAGASAGRSPGCSPLGVWLHGSGRASHLGRHCERLSAFVQSFRSSHPITNHNCCHLLSTCYVHSLGWMPFAYCLAQSSDDGAGMGPSFLRGGI